MEFNKNRKPLSVTPHYELGLTEIEAEGWLKDQLKIQANGLTGHLEEIWESVGSYNGWLGGSGDPWERAPYYLDGLVPLAYLLDDNELKEKAQKWIEWTLKSQNEEGWFGPERNNDWWSRMVQLKVLQQYFEATKDDRILPFMDKYFSYMHKNIKHRPLVNWGKSRGSESILIAIWLYNLIEKKYLIELIDILFSQTFDWTSWLNDLPFREPTAFYYDWETIRNIDFFKKYELMGEFSTHTVNVAMGIKLPTIYSQISSDEIYKTAALKGINSLMKYHGIANGIWSGDEHLMGTSPSQGSEFCSVNEFMFSMEKSLKVLENVELADRIEKLMFNAVPGTMNDSYTAHQYDQQANQVLCTVERRVFYNNYDEANTFGLEPYFGCCTANMHQGIPKYVTHMWMKTKENGLAAMLYGPCKVDTVLNGQKVTINEETNYPFDGKIKFKFRLDSDVAFPLKLRKPKWANSVFVTVDGEKKEYKEDFIVIQKKFSNNDEIVLDIPMDIRTSRWHNDSAAIERGPLLFSLKIDSEWKKYGRTEPFADWEIYPKSPWNYALTNDFESNISVKVNKDVPYQPFSYTDSPIELSVTAQRLNSWQIEKGSAQDVPKSPVVTDEKVETITLIPYAAAKLRITCFPVAK